MTEEQLKNKELCERFPFLEIKDADYECTWLDAIPDGWRKAFGEQMCEELKAALLEENALDDYQIEQVKEKYGGLRWYTNATTRKALDIADKYEILSEKICIKCGQPATCTTTGWIVPLCDACAAKAHASGARTVPIDEYPL